MYRIHRRQFVIGMATLTLAAVASMPAVAQPDAVGPLPGGIPASMQKPNPIPLTVQSVPEMLKQLGYAVTEMKYPNGQLFWEIVTQAEGWTYTVQVTPYLVQGKIAALDLTCELGRKINPQASASVLVKLMQWNYETGVDDRFAYNPHTGCVILKRPYNLPDATLEEMRVLFGNFFNTLRATYPLWNPLQTGSGVPAPLAAPPAPAQAPLAPPAIKSVAGTVWTGSETLPGFGKLTFQFQAHGKAVMIDAKSTVEGTWQQNGSAVTIRFNGCVYHGHINGHLLSGTAQSTAGNAHGPSWSFQVALQKN